MKEVTKTFYKAYKITINCVENDWDDIKCGGSPILGYEFYVDIDSDPREFEAFIRKSLKDLNRKNLMSIKITENHEVQTLWTKDMIFKCISDHNFDW